MGVHHFEKHMVFKRDEFELTHSNPEIEGCER